MAFYTETEKRLRLLDRQRRALDMRRDAVTATAVDLVLHHGQELGPTARRAGLTAHALRQAVHAHPEIASILLGVPEG
ncbi:hypothetical protein ACH4FX_40400 [Streptomyces sp. NPDC018019]|uniref:hypothetical protein n=1 Tax=Streptomyces sp. NPDC018019 TaxID=3365030 RepID=UPI00379848E1